MSGAVPGKSCEHVWWTIQAKCDLAVRRKEPVLFRICVSVTISYLDTHSLFYWKKVEFRHNSCTCGGELFTDATVTLSARGTRWGHFNPLLEFRKETRGVS